MAGCAAAPDPSEYETDWTLGRIARISDGYSTPGASGASGVPVMVGSAVVNVRNDGAQKLMHGYEILSVDGQILTNYSERRFKVGDCVLLRHQPLAPFSDNAEFNVVAGTLFAAKECPAEPPQNQ